MAQEILTPAFDGGGDCVKLPYVCKRSEELGAELLTKVSNGVTPLHQNITHAGPRGVGLQNERDGEIRQGEHRCGGHGLLELGESSLGLGCPFEPVLTQELGQWFSYLGITVKKTPVEPG